jgi:hypothetical protein
MRNFVYTFVEVQCSVFVEMEQAIAPNGLSAAMIPSKNSCYIKWPYPIYSSSKIVGAGNVS